MMAAEQKDELVRWAIWGILLVGSLVLYFASGKEWLEVLGLTVLILTVLAMGVQRGDDRETHSDQRRTAA